MIVKPVYLQCVTLPLLLGYAISELTQFCVPQMGQQEVEGK